MVGVFQPMEISTHHKSTAHLAVDLNPELICIFWVAITSQLNNIIFMAERMYHTNSYNFSSVPFHSSCSIIVFVRATHPSDSSFTGNLGGKETKQANHGPKFLSSKYIFLLSCELFSPSIFLYFYFSHHIIDCSQIQYKCTLWFSVYITFFQWVIFCAYIFALYLILSLSWEELFCKTYFVKCMTQRLFSLDSHSWLRDVTWHTPTSPLLPLGNGFLIQLRIFLTHCLIELIQNSSDFSYMAICENNGNTEIHVPFSELTLPRASLLRQGTLHISWDLWALSRKLLSCRRLQGCVLPALSPTAGSALRSKPLFFTSLLRPAAWASLTGELCVVWKTRRDLELQAPWRVSSQWHCANLPLTLAGQHSRLSLPRPLHKLLGSCPHFSHSVPWNGA